MPWSSTPNTASPDFEIGDARPDHADDAREVATHNVRELVKLVSSIAAPHLGIGAVDAGRVNIDHHFAGSGFRVRRLAVAHHLRPAVVRQQHRFHGRPPSHYGLLNPSIIARSSRALAKSPQTPYLMALRAPTGERFMDPAISSLIDRAGLDKGKVRQMIGRGLDGADDGELFLEYKQAEALIFDNGRLKQATYDTAQGFGLRAVKDEAVGYAHASDVSEAALARAADAVRAVKGGHSGITPSAPGRTNRKLYGDDNPLGAPSFESQGEIAGVDRRLCPRQGCARAAGHRQHRRHLAGGGNPARRRRELSRHPSAGAAERVRRRRRRRPAGIGQLRRRRARRLSALHRRPMPGRARSTKRCARRWSISTPWPHRPARWTWCSAPAGRA